MSPCLCYCAQGGSDPGRADVISQQRLRLIPVSTQKWYERVHAPKAIYRLGPSLSKLPNFNIKTERGDCFQLSEEPPRCFPEWPPQLASPPAVQEAPPSPHPRQPCRFVYGRAVERARMPFHRHGQRRCGPCTQSGGSAVRMNACICIDTDEPGEVSQAGTVRAHMVSLTCGHKEQRGAPQGKGGSEGG